MWHPVVIIINTFYVDVRIWPHNRLKNHLVLDFVSAEQSLSENFTHFWPNFSLGPPVLQFLFQKSKKTTSNAAVPLRAWWWWEKSRQQWSALCKQQQWSITSAFFQYFLKLFSLSSFSGSQWLKIHNSKRLILTTSELRLLSVNYLEYSRLPQLLIIVNYIVDFWRENSNTFNLIITQVCCEMRLF